MQNAKFRSNFKFEKLTQSPQEQLAMSCNVSFNFNRVSEYFDDNGLPTEQAVKLFTGNFVNDHKSPFFTQHLEKIEHNYNIASLIHSSIEMAGIDYYCYDGKFHYVFSLFAGLKWFNDDRLPKDFREKIENGIKSKFPQILPIFYEAQKKRAKLGKVALTESEMDLYAKFSLVRENFQIEIPLFIKNQLIRHIQGFSFTEISRRYTFDGVEFFMPENYLELGLLPKAADTKRQGRNEEMFITETSQDLHKIKEGVELAYLSYLKNIEGSVAPEFARNILPQCTYTTLVVSMTVSCAARICGLRLDYHTQKETRDFANLIYDHFSANYSEFDDLIEISKKYF